MSPSRIQRRRTKGWRAPEGAVHVARPSRFGNPYRVGSEGVPDQATAVDLFRRHLELTAISPGTPSSELVPGAGIPDLPSVGEIRYHLAGRTLMCWCVEGSPCHADVLLEIANGGAS